MEFDSSRWRFPRINHNNKRWLNRTVKDQEIKVAVGHMGMNKALDPEGLLTAFFRHC